MSRATNNAAPDAVVIEMYRTAFARLSFQDEYLFKFSAVFLTIQGALGVAVTAELRGANVNPPILIVLSVLGASLGIVWWLWIRQNDYWHSVWIGTLRRLEEKNQLSARVFALDHHQLASQGQRSKRLVWRGHTIAGLVPLVLSFGWIVLFVGSIIDLNYG